MPFWWKVLSSQMNVAKEEIFWHGAWLPIAVLGGASFFLCNTKSHSDAENSTTKIRAFATTTHLS